MGEGFTTAQAKRLKALERENGQLRRVVADLTLDKLIFEETATGTCWAPRGGAVAVVCEGLGVSERRAGLGPAPGDPTAGDGASAR